MNTTAPFQLNPFTRFTAVYLTTLTSFAGIFHGIFEVLQGDKLIDTFFIQSIGPEHQRWLNGEEAFSILPSYLTTGITAIVISLFIIWWGFKKLHTIYGPGILAVAVVLLILVGGGIVHMLYFIPVLIFSGRIRNKISWRKNKPEDKSRRFLVKAWPSFLTLATLGFLASLALAGFGIPGTSEIIITAGIATSLLLALVFYLLSFLAAFARDI